MSRKRKLPLSGEKPKRQQRIWCKMSPLMSGVKDRPLMEKGEGKLLEAALNAWLARRGITWSHHRGAKKK